MRTLAKLNHNDYPVVPSFFDDWGIFKNFFPSDISKSLNTIPSVNIKETDTAFELELAAPGFSKEDLKIDIDGKRLTISAKKEVENEEKETKYTRKEFSYSSFERSFNLPERAVETDKITAKYTEGILQLHIPKAEPVINNKRISIE